MKKSLIAGAGVAALAMAALPFAGVFAANSITDTVIVTISSSCQVGSTTSASGSGTQLGPEEVANGATKEWVAGTDGGTIKVSCNDSTGWNIKAVGVGDDATVKTAMNAAATGTDIATGTTFSGATSHWGFKVSGTNTISPYNSDYQEVPSTATKVAGNSTMVSEGTINTGYKVFVSATQEADTYTGKVQYTVSTGNA